ncbi:MAG: motility protein A [Oscillospiraceae bacterium]|jgi:chemotaxis protein MotA
MSTLVGILSGFACVVISFYIGGGSVGLYLNLPSVFITLGGVICATLASFPLKRLKETARAVVRAFKKDKTSINDDVEMLIELANTARKEGILALEGAVGDIQDAYLKKGIMLIVDGSDPELIKGIMETELDFIKERHSENRTVLEAMAAYSPAFGLIGTLIGLINMLQSLSDVKMLGPQMAIALVTTFYGSMLANLVFTPLSKKLKAVGNQEYLRKEMILEGFLSIQDGENPRIIREKLNAFMSRAESKDTQVSLVTPDRGEKKVG